MRKALSLQRELGGRFDVTLDLEDGAPAGAEASHRELVVEMLRSDANAHGARLDGGPGQTRGTHPTVDPQGPVDRQAVPRAVCCCPPIFTVWLYWRQSWEPTR